ncbi:MAG: aminopeptidase P family N-terminal domain-containing protein, partial [Paenibacillus macerans]|nr:aminopeptidase P family N-terminal domain-containing protein [Paenibacillus macerans]
MEAQRLEKVRAALKRQGIDGLLIASPYNRRYVTGFTGTAGT